MMGALCVSEIFFIIWWSSLRARSAALDDRVKAVAPATLPSQLFLLETADLSVVSNEENPGMTVVWGDDDSSSNFGELVPDVIFLNLKLDLELGVGMELGLDLAVGLALALESEALPRVDALSQLSVSSDIGTPLGLGDVLPISSPTRCCAKQLWTSCPLRNSVNCLRAKVS